MDEQRVQRRLAAILAADVVGYSRLTGTDEEGTIARLRALRRELIDPAIAEHRGRIVKTTGDGILIEFASVVDAVRCAVDVQRGMMARNRDVPANNIIEFRVGINLGDVVVEGGDLLGDGVNVAARLEGLAEPGGIRISGSAYDQVRDKLALPFADLGEQVVKNIARPVRVYALDAQVVASLPEEPASSGTPSSQRPGRGRRIGQALAAPVAVILIAGGLWFTVRQTSEPQLSTTPNLSIVVLPFANLSGDPAQDYLADVITEGLTTSLSRFKGLFVIARSTAFTYREKAVEVKQIGRDLGVRYVLEGSEQQQHGGDRLRVNAQLIDAETGAHVWAEQFDADRADLLDIQDEIVTRLARALDIEIVATAAARIARTRPGNMGAEDLAMRCRAGVNSSPFNSPEREAAYGLCEHALQMDDRNVGALSLLALRYAIRPTSGLSSDPHADIRQADELVSRALAVDPENYGAHLAKYWLLAAQKHHEEALVEAERSVALNPSYIPAYIAVCVVNLILGRPERTIEYADRAIRLSPRDPQLWLFYHEKGVAYSMLQNGAQAIEQYRRAMAMAPQFPLT